MQQNFIFEWNFEFLNSRPDQRFHPAVVLKDLWMDKENKTPNILVHGLNPQCVYVYLPIYYILPNLCWHIFTLSFDDN